MPKQNLDDFDRKILAALQADARLSNVDLAERVGLSPSPCLRRVVVTLRGDLSRQQRTPARA